MCNLLLLLLLLLLICVVVYCVCSTTHGTMPVYYTYPGVARNMCRHTPTRMTTPMVPLVRYLMQLLHL